MKWHPEKKMGHIFSINFFSQSPHDRILWTGQQQREDRAEQIDGMHQGPKWQGFMVTSTASKTVSIYHAPR